MPTTSNRSYTYPASTADTQLWTHFENLADDVDADVQAQSDRITVLEGKVLMVRKTADEAAPTSAASVQDDDHLSIAVAANSTYFVDGWIIYSAASNTPDLRTNYSYPAGSTFVRAEYGPPSASTAAADTVDTSTATSGDNGRGAGSTERALIVKGELKTSGTAGTFKFRFGQVTSSADAVTVKQGSRLVLTKFA